MILTVNIGNTHITIAGYEHDALQFSGRLHSDAAATIDEYAMDLLNLLSLYRVQTERIEGGILGSVVPALTGRVLAALRMLCSARFLTVGPGLKSGIKLRLDNPAQLGAELLCGAVAALAETPGPLAVNMATFVGSSQGGFWGALVATLGVVLPSFLLLLLIAAVLRNLMKYRGVEAFLSGVRPCVVALILATAVTMGLTRLLGFTHLGDVPAPDIRSLLVLAVLAAVHFLWKKLRGKVPSPIAMIGLSAVLGILLWSI